MESIEKFRKLGLGEKLLNVIRELKFTEPSEIQEKAIPLIMEGKDVIGSSATGSGKTLTFGAGIIEKAIPGEGIQALILTPTRELAEQITHNLKNFSKHYELRVQDVYGGVSIVPQIRALESADIVVGTPGRILDHLERRTIDLRKVKFLVLDEADRMLDMGFIDDVTKIIESCPAERQTLLFSATISVDIDHIAKKYMKHPIHVDVENRVDPTKLKQIFYDVPNDMKFSLLVHLLKQEKEGLVMVFCNTRRNTDMIAKSLARYEIDSLAIHGGLSQNRRNDIMKSFHTHKALILVCTDVAARGLDVKNVSHIYNYDIPKNSTEYVHRIGRTARAGKEGIAISFVSPRDYQSFRSVCDDPTIAITNEKLPELEPLRVSFKSGFERGNFRRGGFRGGGFRREGFRDNRRGNFGGGQRRGNSGYRQGNGERRFASRRRF